VHCRAVCNGRPANKLNENSGLEITSPPFKQFSKETQRHTPISVALHQNINDIAILIYCPPEMLAFTIDCYKNLIQVPSENWHQTESVMPIGNLCLFPGKENPKH